MEFETKGILTSHCRDLTVLTSEKRLLRRELYKPGQSQTVFFTYQYKTSPTSWEAQREFVISVMRYLFQQSLSTRRSNVTWLVSESSLISDLFVSSHTSSTMHFLSLVLLLQISGEVTLYKHKLTQCHVWVFYIIEVFAKLS